MSGVEGVIIGEDGNSRCWWCVSDPEYIRYHDEEWGRPVVEDRLLFEKICLEGFQAGLSWLTILRKRNAFRKGFAKFQIKKVAKFGQADIDRLVVDAGIVRHRGKIESTINNAKRALELIDEFGSLAKYFWQYEPAHSQVIRTQGDIVPQIEESKAMSKDLKKRGWSFVGPTTCYAFMQSMGMVNDHIHDCEHWAEIEKLRSVFERP
ncbi:DNA-3-methyladenine glycosylase I [Rubinisphaera sp.]|mgnify:CR=1 FL=1|uniref:DNA-3-methyladenine glycosylase I n=1 Tax=Rubinisphaera sp. TaxID=2024857 RepID=UPI000C0CD241|nr:DNA-3-methyladenine glycosylase I [Rubinisphaera sp.]MBV10181.1 DNA-3-methyladenine glycosylase I [Rubinisphaera sp.]HCS52744.1 DNA-3-methyladenine glycosylase I [Planctomycetaceae bacterium]|tara:strand:- start:89 stop:709 length:621 start_codon:yes stop_codon:yes gene_type:complete